MFGDILRAQTGVFGMEFEQIIVGLVGIVILQLWRLIKLGNDISECCQLMQSQMHTYHVKLLGAYGTDLQIPEKTGIVGGIYEEVFDIRKLIDAELNRQRDNRRDIPPYD